MNQLVGRVAVSAAAIFVIVGCGGGTSTPASNPVSTQSTGTGAPTAAAGQTSAPATAPVAASTAPASGPALPPIFSSHADAGLEGQLPAEVSGTSMARYSIGFAELLGDSTDRASIDAFLKGMGKSEADGSFAAALDPTNALGGGIFAFKVNGADAATLLGGIVEVEKSDLGAGATTSQATIGGKDVTVLSIGSGVNDTEWIYGRGDVVFIVHAADEAHAAAFLQAIQ